MKKEFFGRKEELATLTRFMQKTTASLIVVRGRRRIGKSRLIEEFAKKEIFYSFVGLFPVEGTTAQSQRNEFIRQMSRQTGLPEIKADDWSTIFTFLFDNLFNNIKNFTKNNSKSNLNNRIILLFDEISWMGSKDPDFLGKIKNAWDILFKKNHKLMFIMCGSASSWIEKNILSSTGFLGRVSHTLTLEELTLPECSLFWGKSLNHISAYEKFKILSVIGGIPKYLEEIDPKLPAEDNIKNLCFKNGAYFVEEFDHIFSDLFLHKSHLYKTIVETLVDGAKSMQSICLCLKTDQSGRISECLEELQLSGYVKRDHTWNIRVGLDIKLSKYRLSDNYLRFYLKYIAKYKTQILRNSFVNKSINSLPGWYAILGFQFENLVLNNRSLIHKTIGISADDIVCENPFFQTKTLKQPGCQIDYMIQTKFNTLYICEIKFSKNPIGLDVVKEVESKLKCLKYPKGTSCRPVLIHVNGVTDELVENSFFAKIIDFCEFL